MPDRPAVSVIVPFAGPESAARSLLEGLRPVELGTGDELIVVDNTPGASSFPAVGATAATVVRAESEHSSYYARNAGAEQATNEWLLFMDADCRPDPDILDRYFDLPLAPRCAIVAGSVCGAEGQRGLLPQWARSRRQLSEEHLVDGLPSTPHPASGTGNLLVRRSAFETLGGFHEGVVSGADMELCWRLQDAGWELVHRPAARVGHRYRKQLRSLVRQSARHAAGRRWVSRRYPNAFSRPPVARELGRSLAGLVVWNLALRPRRALFKLIDGIVTVAAGWGWVMGRNGIRPVGERRVRADGPRALVMVTDAFPARSETFVYNEAQTLIRQGWDLRVESLARPARTEREVARSLRLDYLEDDAPRDKLRDLGWLLVRHPWRCLRDVIDARRWSREEEVWSLAALAPAARRLASGRERHLHAHFAAGGALVTMRLSRLLGVPFAMTAHAYEIFQQPRNLAEKIRSASFVAAECDYAARRLIEIGGPGAERKVHRIATGTDGQRFRRRRPYPGEGRVVAVGRLVEKKGFDSLIRAAAMLRDDDHVSEIVIAGEGPLDGRLRALIDDKELDPFVRLLGPLWGPEAIRDLLETADVLVVPSVIAADGDRDALPLVAYEALAMEVPVIASDLVGLPELVKPPWGELVEPARPDILASAIATFLRRPAKQRADAGERGREFALERFDPEREAARLGALIASGYKRSAIRRPPPQTVVEAGACGEMPEAPSSLPPTGRAAIPRRRADSSSEQDSPPP